MCRRSHALQARQPVACTACCVEHAAAAAVDFACALLFLIERLLVEERLLVVRPTCLPTARALPQLLASAGRTAMWRRRAC